MQKVFEKHICKKIFLLKTWNIVTKLCEQTKFEELQPELKHIFPVWPDSEHFLIVKQLVSET